MYNTEPAVVITNERYAELIQAETERDIIVAAAKAEDGEYSLGGAVKTILRLHLNAPAVKEAENNV